MQKTTLLAKLALEKLKRVDFLLPNLLVPVVVLVFYAGTFAWLSSRLLPEGVNYLFASKLWKYGAFLLAGICLVILSLLGLRRNSNATFRIKRVRFSPADGILLLLPLTPVVQYILSNRDTLSPLGSLCVVAFFLLFSGLYLLAMPALFGLIGSSRVLMFLSLAFVTTLTSMALLSSHFFWFGSGSFRIQLVFLAGVFLTTWLLSFTSNRKILLIMVVAFFVVNGAFQLVSASSRVEGASLSVEDNRLLSSVAGRLPVSTPNIYLLVYDSYVANETMLAYGIDNSIQEDYLKGQGFVLFPHTYSIGAGTIESMSRVLNASTDYYGNSRRGVSGDGIVQNLLRTFGYRIYGIFPNNFMFRGIGSSYDFFISGNSTPPEIQLVKAILMGEFRFDLGLNDQPHEKFIENKQGIFNSLPVEPVFIYAHSDLPDHSQNSGACLPDEVELYQQRLSDANLEMRQDIQTITQNDPDAIVVLAGDHGPYLTKNCAGTSGTYAVSEISRLDIQDRFGSFLAIRWPTEGYESDGEITVLQDIFPVIFAYLFQDSSILAGKIDPITLTPSKTSGASVRDGVIFGGINDGEPLFLSG
jgi:hypothetical protein